MTKEEQIEYLMKRFGMTRYDASSVLRFYSLEKIIESKTVVFLGHDLCGWPTKVVYESRPYC